MRSYTKPPGGGCRLFSPSRPPFTRKETSRTLHPPVFRIFFQVPYPLSSFFSHSSKNRRSVGVFFFTKSDAKGPNRNARRDRALPSFPFHFSIFRERPAVTCRLLASSGCSNSFICHTSAKSAANSFPCHTSKNRFRKSFVCHTSEPPPPGQTTPHESPITVRQFPSRLSIFDFPKLVSPA